MMEADCFWQISRGIFHVLWLSLYWYCVCQTGSMEKGAGKRAVGFLLTAVLLGISLRYPLFPGWLLITGIILLFDLFFDAEPFGKQWRTAALPGICLWAAQIFDSPFLVHGGILYLFLILLWKKRESLRLWNGLLTGTAFLIVSAFLWILGCTELAEMDGGLRGALLWGGILLEMTVFLAIEGTLYSYKKGFDFQAEQFRTELLEHNYAEIREIYMDMRGWRHDYHNHMQVMKAQLTMGSLEGIEAYLDKLERELDRVDTLVKSGNLMTDAILNSKLTLARRKDILVNCTAKLPEQLPVEDVDLCVILGNLLDNAIEGCGRMEKGDRFLRVYLAVNGNQLYFSVQNSAKEEPDFEERNYITKKRGNHGLGMKRVKAAVDKYQGYLNLANEPGIFAAEVTMPV